MLQSQTMGRGAPLCLLHGWGAHSGLLTDLAKQLTNDFQVTLIDLPGFGQSPMLTDAYNLTTVVEQLLTVAPPSAMWLGWSLGGLVATQLAITHSQRVTKLINVCSSPKFVATKQWPGIAENNLKHFSALLQQDYQNTLKHFVTLQFYGADVSHETIRQVQQDTLKYQPHQQALQAGLELLLTTDLRAELSTVTQPTLFVFGEHDVIVPVEVAKHINQLSPQAQIATIANASHAPFLSHQALFLQTLIKFLKQ